ncbi:hypothetical protein Z045_05715 [Rhodococcus pyridinivorans KG-16]|uniref:Uncharacterized protein n=1 Tax=Rhodococcus pyridinivorans KG-16 TaxID=1441730 RepID=A0A0V9UNT7_9NOCA|nr:hypothetical protein [Rhodococcus pyridinivorans]KSZ59666.1 hypothetical protein Z045_05715 [Rhodococcus pyridinivorans KG-16]
MNDFENLVNQELLGRQSEAERYQQRRAQAVKDADEGAAAIAALLRELADYVAQHVEPRTVVIKKEKWPFRDKVSPAGWVLRDNNDSFRRRFQLLLPSGEIWDYADIPRSIDRNGTMHLARELYYRQKVEVGELLLAWGQRAFTPIHEDPKIEDGVWAVHYSYFAWDSRPPPLPAREELAKLAAEIVGS